MREAEPMSLSLVKDKSMVAQSASGACTNSQSYQDSSSVFSKNVNMKNK